MRFITTLKAGCPVFMLRFLRASNIKMSCNDFISSIVAWNIIVCSKTPVHNYFSEVFGEITLHTYAYLAYQGMQAKNCCPVRVIYLLAYLAYLFIIFRYI